MLDTIIILVMLLLVLAATLYLGKGLYTPEQQKGEQIELAVIGPSGVGKTVFLATLVDWLSSSNGEVIWGKFLDDETEKQLRKLPHFQRDQNSHYYQPHKRSTEQLVRTVLARFAAHEVQPTIHPEILYLQVWGKIDPSQKTGDRHLLVLRDIPGRLFEESYRWKENTLTEELARSRGIILIIGAPDLVARNTYVHSPVWRNYVDAVEYRLQQAHKYDESFPVWIVLTKGDLLTQKDLERNTNDWLQLIPKLPGIFPQESERITTCLSLVSACNPANEDMCRQAGVPPQINPNTPAANQSEVSPQDHDQATEGVRTSNSMAAIDNTSVPPTQNQDENQTAGKSPLEVVSPPVQKICPALLEKLYQSVGQGIQKIYPVVLREIKARQKRQQHRRQCKRWAFCVGLFLCLVLLFECWGSYNFHRLPGVPFSRIARSALLQRAQRLADYYEHWWAQGLVLPRCLQRPSQVYQRLAALHKEIIRRLRFQMSQVPALPAQEIGAHIQIMQDLLRTCRRLAKIVHSLSSHIEDASEFLEKLKEWHVYQKTDAVKPLLELYIKLPPRQEYLREFARAQLRQRLVRTLQEYDEEACSFTGSHYFPDRLKPLYQWRDQYGKLFPQLKKHFPQLYSDWQRRQKSHWEYCWYTRKQEIQRMADTLQKIEALRDFREKAPAGESWPPSIKAQWQKLCTALLANWPAENEQRRKKKKALFQWFKLNAQLDFLSIEWEQFSRECRGAVKRILKSPRDQGQTQLRLLQQQMQAFLKSHAQQPTFLPKWQYWKSRQAELANFTKVREVVIKVRAYGCRPRIAEKKWNDDFWEAYYPYLRIEVENQDALIFTEGAGQEIYHGEHQIKLMWAPWDQIRVVIMEADDKVDGVKIVDDDVLHTFKPIHGCLSLLELTRDKHVEQQGHSKCWYHLELVSAGLPEWILALR